MAASKRWQAGQVWLRSQPKRVKGWHRSQARCASGWLLRLRLFVRKDVVIIRVRYYLEPRTTS